MQGTYASHTCTFMHEITGRHATYMPMLHVGAHMCTHVTHTQAPHSQEGQQAWSIKDSVFRG